MSRHNSTIALQHMLDHAQEALALTKGKVRKDLDADRTLNLALTRLLEIIGESANRIPIEEQRKYSELPWSQMIGLRNRLIHGYDEVDFDLLWQIVIHDLPDLVRTLEKILGR